MFYQLRKRVNIIRFRRYAQGIYETPPTPCEPQARCTLHTMLGQADLLMYLVAIKSFLRFKPRVRVTVHSDGSLSAVDASTLRAHIPGIRVVSAQEADDRAKESLGPFLAEWRARDASWRRVLDTELWCETPRRMIMDADILTLHRPEQVLDWIQDEAVTRPLLFGATDAVPAGPIPPRTGQRHIQTIFREQLAELALQSGRAPEFYQGGTSGYYGCGRELSLAEIERLIRAGLAAGVPMAEWGGEQCLVVYVLSTSNPIRLDRDKYFNFAPENLDRIKDAAVVHFYGTFRYYRGHYRRLAAQVIRELKTATKAKTD